MSTNEIANKIREINELKTLADHIAEERGKTTSKYSEILRIINGASECTKQMFFDLLYCMEKHGQPFIDDIDQYYKQGDKSMVISTIKKWRNA